MSEFSPTSEDPRTVSHQETPTVESASVPPPTGQEQEETRPSSDDQGSEVSAPVDYETPPEAGTGGRGSQPPPPAGGGDGPDGEEPAEEQMVKMSFLDHLDELRKRIIYSLIAVAVAFFICFSFARRIFDHMSEPLRATLRDMGMQEQLYFIKPTDAFTLYLNLALIIGLFLASPFVLYQVWAFITPGLYRRERRYAVPFVFFCSSLFIGGGLFGYYIAFPFALRFLLTFGGERLVPWITATEYMNTFWTVILGLGIIFELPVLMLFLGLLGILTPGFLMRNFRYAVLLIVIVAAVVTPTADIINLMIFAMPMMALYMVGVGLVWLVTRRRRTT